MSDDYFVVPFLIIILCLGVFTLGCGAGTVFTGRDWQRATVERGLAHWEVDALGQTTWCWNEETEEPDAG